MMISEEYSAGLDGLLPDPARSVVAVLPPSNVAGAWAGGPSAVLAGGEIVLAYRLRRPVGQGRGFAVVVARSSDGEDFQTLQVITKEQMDAESLERPVLAVTADGSWRLYLSCATWGTKHWRVELLEGHSPDAFDVRRRRVVLPGDQARAVKDPVIVQNAGSWHMWACIHPLTEPDQTDRMWSEYASSANGLDWTWHGPALLPRPGQWDARGVRVSDVRFTADGVVAYYDGRATAAENFEERTGVAVGALPGTLTALGSEPAAESPVGRRGLRYVSTLPLGDGRARLYYELTRADGAHELRTELR
ncbi:MAG TPA: hypothetical protein VEL03_14265 [Streptosporangiaceae bacterium]|nr:hypothetical protein [Streptosporangiaceae bacterium]